MNLYMRKLILGDAENNFAAACKVNAVVCKEDFSQIMKFSMDIHRVKSKKKIFNTLMHKEQTLN